MSAGAGMALSAVGSIGGLVSSIIGANKQKKALKAAIDAQMRIHEAESASREKYSQMVRADADIAQNTLLQAEQARLDVFSDLGQPDTYGASYTPGPISLGVLEPTGLAGLSPRDRGVLTASGKTVRSGMVTGGDVSIGTKGIFKGVRNWEVEGASLDPTALAGAVKGTAGFRTVSRMVAEAEQLINRQGPLWEELNNSVVGSIYESSAALQRQQMEQLSRDMARGGTARRVGLKTAQAMQIQEGINRTRSGQLWQAKLGLEDYRTKYAQGITSFSQDWVNNQAGIRDSFSAALSNLQMHWSSTMAPALVGASVKAQTATQAGTVDYNMAIADTIAKKFQAISGAFQSLGGMGGMMMGGKGGGGSPALAAGK